MTLYEIKQEILDCIDLETGEITDPEKLEQLQIDKHEKLRNIAFMAINASADIEAYKAQENWAKETLSHELAGQKMKEAEFTISYRSSEAVEIDAGAEIPAEYLKMQEPTIDKVSLKKAIKDGKEIKGCRLVTKSNIQIK